MTTAKHIKHALSITLIAILSISCSTNKPDQKLSTEESIRLVDSNQKNIQDAKRTIDSGFKHTQENK